MYLVTGYRFCENEIVSSIEQQLTSYAEALNALKLFSSYNFKCLKIKYTKI